ncbi:ABC-three component system middle component 6 [Streptomyces mirabilis]|uniref:ABC-three component system middle component 6 n=1 Tax=Streptomyces mirabilis TaxID=68239 RepID=UPI0038B53CE3
MITPTKGIAPDRCLLAIGAQVLLQLDEPRSVSQTWARLKAWRSETPSAFRSAGLSVEQGS